MHAKPLRTRRKLLAGICLLVAVALFTAGGSTAQEEQIPPVPEQGHNFLRIGRLWFTGQATPDDGWESQFIWPGGEVINYMFLRYPKHWKRWYNYNARVLGGAAGVMNWKGPNDSTYAYFTSEAYRKVTDDQPEWSDDPNRITITPIEQWMYMRFPPPQVTVEGQDLIPEANENFTTRYNGRIDESLVTDKALYGRCLFTMGLQMDKWVYAFASDPEKDIIFIDITLTNTGVPDWKSYVTGQVPLQGQTLHSLRYTHICQARISDLGWYTPALNIDDWGEVIYPWPSVDRPFTLIYDGDGDRNPLVDFGDFFTRFRDVKEVGPKLVSPGFMINGYIHVDHSWDDETDDPAQPTDVHFAGELMDCFFGLNNTDKTHEKNYEILFLHGRTPSVDQGGVIHNKDTNPSIARQTGEGYYCVSYNGVGPYELPFGEDIHLSYVTVMGGISQKLCYEIGKAISERTPHEINEDEIALWATGRDSAIAALTRAYWVYHGTYPDGSHPKPPEFDQPYNVPDPPRPPAHLWIDVVGKAVRLRWTDEAETTPDWDTGVIDFAGYRIYRATGARDSVYHLIADIKGHATSYLDTNVTVGTAYFYYLTAYDDGTQNWEEPGKSLESGRFYCWSGWLPYKGVVPKVESETDTPEELKNIRVVPNPFSINGPQYPGDVEERNKINFVNLPGECTIRIYNTAGVLIKTIHHTDGTDLESWNLRTDYNQYVASDVYIFTVESKIGNYAGKFVIVR